MSAALLRQAAARLRVLAEDASPQPWSVYRTGTHHCVKTDRTLLLAGYQVAQAPESKPANAAYIAAMHPGVTLLVADVLDHMAETQEADEQDGTGGAEGCDCPWCRGLPLLISLAQAVVKEES